jgi:hypothetical protein
LDRTPVLATGLLLGLAADVRLFCAGLLPLFLCWVWPAAPAERRRAELFRFLGGFALAVAPNLFLLALDPAAYLFGNMGFHAIRREAGLIGNFDQKAETLQRLLLGGGEGNGPQMTILLALSILGVTLATRLGIASGRRALQLTFTLGLLSLLPTPTFVQYFSLCMPFLIAAAVCPLGLLLNKLAPERKRAKWACCVAGLSLFAALSMRDYPRFLRTGKGVTGIMAEFRAFRWKTDAVAAVTRTIDELAAPREQVMSLWPGYLIESRAMPFPGLENNSATYLSGRLTAEQLRKYHIASERTIEAALARHNPRLFVLGNEDSMEVEAQPYQAMLVRQGYTQVRVVAGATLWIAPR